MSIQALGILETRGLVPALVGADAMLKTADITLIGRQQAGDGLVAVIVQGDITSVKAAMEAGTAAARPLGPVLAAKVLPCPHEDLEKLLPTLG